MRVWQTLAGRKAIKWIGYNKFTKEEGRAWAHRADADNTRHIITGRVANNRKAVMGSKSDHAWSMAAQCAKLAQQAEQKDEHDFFTRMAR